MNAVVLPLAITMMAGPQILSSIIFVTTKNPIRISLAYLSGILIALIGGVSLWLWIFSNLLTESSVGADTSGDTGLKPTQIALVGLLIYLAIHTYLNRENVQQPKWLTGLNAMKPARAVVLGLMLILLFPSDFVILMTVGATLADANQELSAAVPFIAATFLLAAAPLLFYLIFRRKMETVMPKVRDWMGANSWLVNIFVYVIFIFLIV